MLLHAHQATYIERDFQAILRYVIGGGYPARTLDSDTLGVPVYLCTCVPVYLCTCVPVYLCTCVPVYLCTCVPVYRVPVHPVPESGSARGTPLGPYPKGPFGPPCRPNMIRDAPPTCGAESSEWVYQATYERRCPANVRSRKLGMGFCRCTL